MLEVTDHVMLTSARDCLSISTSGKLLWPEFFTLASPSPLQLSLQLRSTVL